MKCEIHKIEMKWEGDMLTGGPVCPCCNLPDYEEETWTPNFDQGRMKAEELRERHLGSILAENQLTKRLLEGKFKPSPHRQTGRTSRALYNLIKACSEENCTAIYVVHHRAMFQHVKRLLREMNGDGIDHRQIGHDRFLVSFRGMRPIALILATPETTTLRGIKGRTAYDHFIYEEKALAGRVSGDPGAGRGD